jgi:hypothetical protein
MEEYREYIKNNVKYQPDAYNDAERFAGLHSWYKH